MKISDIYCVTTLPHLLHVPHVQTCVLVPVSCLVLVGAAPTPWTQYLQYLPDTVQAFVNSTLEQGQEVAMDLYDDIKEEVLDKTAPNMEGLQGVIGKTVGELMGISDTAGEISKADLS